MSQSLPYNNHSVVGSLDRLAASQSLGGKWELRFPPGLECCYPLSGRGGAGTASACAGVCPALDTPQWGLVSGVWKVLSGRLARLMRAGLPGLWGIRGLWRLCAWPPCGQHVYVGRSIPVSVVLSISGADPVSTETDLWARLPDCPPGI